MSGTVAPSAFWEDATGTHWSPREPDWMTGHEALAERMHEVWRLNGRPDPFDHDMEAWRGFALGVQANVATHTGRPFGVHPDAGDETRNHYDWFFTTGTPTEDDFDRWLIDTEAKMTEALGDVFVNDAARIMLLLIARIRALSDLTGGVS